MLFSLALIISSRILLYQFLLLSSAIFHFPAACQHASVATCETNNNHSKLTNSRSSSADTVFPSFEPLLSFLNRFIPPHSKIWFVYLCCQLNDQGLQKPPDCQLLRSIFQRCCYLFFLFKVRFIDK